MKRLISVSVAIVTAMFLISTAQALKPATPKKTLEKDATHIIVGIVRSISSRTVQENNADLTHYVAVIVIDKIEKGANLKVGDSIDVRYQWSEKRGTGAPPVGDPGHSPRPNESDRVRVYLINKGFNGFGYTTGSGYDVYYNNGFEILVDTKPPL